MAIRARNIAELEGLPDWPALMRPPVAAAYLSLMDQITSKYAKTPALANAIRRTVSVVLG